jgi:hypothetical protein
MNPKVRAITGFVRLEQGTWEKQVTDTLVVLRKAKSEFEAAGYQVETGVGVEKVSTNPLISMRSVWQCEMFSGIF